MALSAEGAQAGGKQASGLRAVVDIGSNSVRLVVFDGPPRVPTPKFNEKVLCGLGRGLNESGQLDEAGVRLALAALRRFAALARVMEVGDLQMVATAAVRDAENGAAFVAEVERQCGVPVRVLAGAEEAQLSAYGVVSGIPEADGLMGDLGGGSLEIVALNKGEPGEGITLPLGPFRLTGLGSFGAMRDRIDEQLATASWLSRVEGRSLYLVGGAWRAIARIHMLQHDNPLRVIHHYRISRAEAEDLSRLLSRQSRDSLARLSGVPRRRLDSLPPAALVLRRIVKRMRPSDVVFSALGLREGLCYAALPAKQRAQDPLLVTCTDVALREGRYAEHGGELDDFIAGLFERETPEQKRLRLAASLLSDIAWRMHPDHRGEYALGRILHGPFVGIDHPGRALLALAIFCRYQGGIDDPAAASARTLLDEATLARAREIGLGLRLAHTLSGGVPGVLASARLKLTTQNALLDVPAAAEPLIGESVQRRLESLARALSRTPEIKVRGKAR